MDQNQTEQSKIQKKAFEKLFVGVILATQIFTGIEDGEILTREQAAYLLAFCQSEAKTDIRKSKTLEQDDRSTEESLSEFWKQKLERADKLKQNKPESLKQQVLIWPRNMALRPFLKQNLIQNISTRSDLAEFGRS